MNKYTLFEAIGNVEDKYILDAERLEGRKVKKTNIFIKGLGIAASLVLIVGVAFVLPRIIDGMLGSENFPADTDTPPDTSIEPEYPEKGEVMAAYGTAREIADWFRLSSSGLIGDTDIPKEYAKIVDGYYVESSRFASFEEFRNYLLSVFSEELTEQFLEKSIVAEYEGKLYVAPCDTGSNIAIRHEAIDVIPVSEDKITVRLTVGINDYFLMGYKNATGETIAYAEVDYPYEKIDGKWVFTDFPDPSIDLSERFWEVFWDKYTTYETEFVTLVLPSEYEAVAVVDDFVPHSNPNNRDYTIMFLVYYVPDKERGYEPGDWVLQIGRMSYEDYEELKREDPFAVTTVGVDNNYYYTLSTVNYVESEPTDEYFKFIGDCTTAILRYMPTINGWEYPEDVFVMFEGTQQNQLTLDEVVELSAKGEELTWSDFAQYAYEDIGSGLYIYRYDIDSNYELRIGGSPSVEPMYIRLVSKANQDNYIDIRTADVNGFIKSNEK